MPIKKKGLTKHHLRYGENEIIVLIPSKGAHLILTSFQSMNATKDNIKLLRNFRRAVSFIIRQKEEMLNGQSL